MKALFLLLLTTLVSLAQFPPAPSTFIYGTVRSGTGAVIDDSDAFLVLFGDDVEVARVQLIPREGFNENYRIQLLNFTDVTDDRVFTVKLDRDGELSGVLEISTGIFTFQPVAAQFTRFDFVEGENGSDDDDLDGLPNDWEETYGGNLDRDDDLDFDGFTNYQEFLAGTDPTDFKSQINFKVLRKTEAGVEVAFDIVAGRSYEVQGDMNDWKVIQGIRATTNRRLTLTVPDHQFYRVGVTCVR